MPKAGTVIPEEHYFLGSTSKKCFLPPSLSCMRDLATSPPCGVGNDISKGCRVCPSYSNDVAAGRTLFPPQCLNYIFFALANSAEDTWMTTRRSLRMQHNSMKRCPKMRLSRPLSGSHAVQNRWGYTWSQFPGKRLRGFASARRYTHARKVDVWTPRQIELTLLLALSQSFFSVSSETWRQRRGVPIGGMVSKILYSVVMGASETRWTEDRVRRESLGFGGKAMLPISATWMTPSH